MPNFRRTVDVHQPDTLLAELNHLPDSQRKDFATEMLGRLNAGNLKTRSHQSEIQMSCPLPFGMHAHGDRNASAHFNYSKMAFNCFVCGGGGLYWFVGTMLDCSSTEARKWLRGEFAIDAGVQDLSKLLSFIEAAFSNEKRDGRAPIPHLDDRIIEPWALIHPYLTEIREIPEQNIIDLRVGYDANSNRIVLPHFWRGDLVGWQTRRLVKDGTSKYKSTPDFPKDQTIYQYHEGSRAVVVESPMSVVAKHHLITDMVATFGAEVTEIQKRLLAKYDSVILWFDNDKAGWKATSWVAEGVTGDPKDDREGSALIDYTTVWVVENPWIQDAGDLPDHEVQRLLSEHLVPYAIWTKPDPETLRDWRKHS